jgi:hypothetical protein
MSLHPSDSQILDGYHCGNSADSTGRRGLKHDDKKPCQSPSPDSTVGSGGVAVF